MSEGERRPEVPSEEFPQGYLKSILDRSPRTKSPEQEVSQRVTEIIEEIQKASLSGQSTTIPIYESDEALQYFNHGPSQSYPPLTQRVALIHKEPTEDPDNKGYYGYKGVQPLEELAQRLGVLPRNTKDNVVDFRDRGRLNDSAMKVHNILPVRHPNLGGKVFWHELFNIDFREYYGHHMLILVTVNKAYIPTTGPFGLVGRLLNR